MSLLKARQTIAGQLGAIDALEKSFNAGKTEPAEFYVGALLIIRGFLLNAADEMDTAVGVELPSKAIGIVRR